MIFSTCACTHDRHLPPNLTLLRLHATWPTCCTQLEQKFPPEDEGLASQHSLDLLKHPLRDLLAASSNQGGQGGQQGQGQPQGDATVFPLIIRLEALTDEGRTENRSLASLAPGAELPQWVQSQTTYARIVREDDGSLGVRVIKQKIWVKGESYELQEIYGMEQNRGVAIGTPAAGPADGFEDVEGNECVICMSAPRDTAALPCRHMCMCHGCASALKTQVGGRVRGRREGGGGRRGCQGQE